MVLFSVNLNLPANLLDNIASWTYLSDKEKDGKLLILKHKREERQAGKGKKGY